MIIVKVACSSENKDTAIFRELKLSAVNNPLVPFAHTSTLEILLIIP